MLESNSFSMLLIILNIHMNVRNKQLSRYDFFVVGLKIELALLLIFLGGR